jgi:hypothetical protein
MTQMLTLYSYRVGWLKDLDDAFSSFRKPVLAAVRGFAVGWPMNSPNQRQTNAPSLVVALSLHSW